MPESSAYRGQGAIHVGLVPAESPGDGGYIAAATYRIYIEVRLEGDPLDAADSCRADTRGSNGAECVEFGIGACPGFSA